MPLLLAFHFTFRPKRAALAENSLMDDISVMAKLQHFETIFFGFGVSTKISFGRTLQKAPRAESGAGYLGKKINEPLNPTEVCDHQVHRERNLKHRNPIARATRVLFVLSLFRQSSIRHAIPAPSFLDSVHPSQTLWWWAVSAGGPFQASRPCALASPSSCSSSVSCSGSSRRRTANRGERGASQTPTSARCSSKSNPPPRRRRHRRRRRSHRGGKGAGRQ